MEEASQREVIVVDATPTPDPEPGGARLQDTVQPAAAATRGEDGSQRSSQPTRYVSTKILLFPNCGHGTCWWKSANVQSEAVPCIELSLSHTYASSWPANLRLLLA